MFEACCHALLSGIAGLPGSGLSASGGPSEADRAVDILARAIAAGYREPVLRLETGLDPLRDRSDFQILLMDLAFPDDPFAPIAGFAIHRE